MTDRTKYCLKYAVFFVGYLVAIPSAAAVILAVLFGIILLMMTYPTPFFTVVFSAIFLHGVHALTRGSLK